VISKEAKVGLLALTAGVILYLGFNFLKGYEIFSSSNKFYVVYQEIDGLTVSNPVLLNGLSVGRVENIQLQPEKNNSLLVTIMVNSEVPVGDSTQALLSNTDLLGGKSIDLIIGPNSKIYEGGETLLGYKKQDITEVLTQKAIPILTNLDSTVVNLNKLFGDQLGSSVRKTLHNLELASSELNAMMIANKTNITSITSNLAQMSSSLRETEKQLSPIIAKFDQLADSLKDLELKETVANAKAALANVESITKKIDEKEGSLGLLINDKELYDNLNKTAENLNKLAQDIEQNPKKYIKITVF
jgi:phospholipid/cholesterol/gamma-HCH transport system substrate-binding protein